MVLGGVVLLGPLCSSMVAKLSRQRSQDTTLDYAAARNRSQRGRLTSATPSSGQTVRAAATQVEDRYSQ
jgi:hypothetical protein